MILYLRQSGQWHYWIQTWAHSEECLHFTVLNPRAIDKMNFSIVEHPLKVLGQKFFQGVFIIIGF